MAVETEREGWPFSYVDRIRFGDLDAMRHLNNVAFLGFFESARIAFIQSLVASHSPVEPEHKVGLIFAEAHINYRSPGLFDEEVRTFIRPRALKRSSLSRMRCTRSEAAGGSVPGACSSRAHRAGLSVSELKAEKMVATAIVIANWR